MATGWLTLGEAKYYLDSSGAITGGMKQKFVEHFDTHEDLAHMLKMRARPGDVILFKGSRGMRMEKALSLFLKEEES